MQNIVYSSVALQFQNKVQCAWRLGLIYGSTVQQIDNSGEETSWIWWYLLSNFGISCLKKREWLGWDHFGWFPKVAWNVLWSWWWEIWAVWWTGLYPQQQFLAVLGRELFQIHLIPHNYLWYKVRTGPSSLQILKCWGFKKQYLIVI